MRWLAVLAVAVTLGGCATGVEDPQPVPAPDEPQRDPPKVTLSGDLDNPYEGIAQERGSTLTDRPRQKPPLPFESNE
jgi:hypothetical protein